MKLFAKLAKFDEATGQFEAVAADETPDRAKEIFDYALSKPHFEKWSSEISKATDGKSVGNVRSMHGKNAAGKLTKLDFLDDTKEIRIVGIAVDPVDKEKLAQGVYTGVSIGGSYGKKWADKDNPNLIRYEAIPAEISLVDLPCNPNAHFTFVKADGAEELRKFVDPEKVAVDALAKLFNDGKVKPSDVLKAAEEAAASAEPDDGKKTSDAADAASAEADEKDTPTAHAAAADAHAKAKDANEKAGNKKTAAVHGKLASYHSAKAKETMPPKDKKDDDGEDEAAEKVALRTALSDPKITNGDVEKLAAKYLPEADRTGSVIELLQRLDKFAGAAVAEPIVTVLDFVDHKGVKRVLDTSEVIKAALSVVGKKASAAKYGDGLKTARAAIEKAYTDRVGALPSAQAFLKTIGVDAELAKQYIPGPDGCGMWIDTGLSAVASFAYTVQGLWNAARQCVLEQEFEGDTESEVPKMLEALAIQAGEILCQMVEEEVREESAEKTVLVGALRKAFVGDKPLDLMPLLKIGARHSKADMDKLQAIHDHSVGMGATCGKSEKGLSTVALCKALGLDETTEAETVNKTVETLLRKATAYDAMPAPTRGVLKSVEKHEDVELPLQKLSASDEELLRAAESGDPLAQVKFVHRFGKQHQPVESQRR